MKLIYIRNKNKEKQSSQVSFLTRTRDNKATGIIKRRRNPQNDRLRMTSIIIYCVLYLFYKYELVTPNDTIFSYKSVNAGKSSNGSMNPHNNMILDMHVLFKKF